MGLLEREPSNADVIATSPMRTTRAFRRFT
jgi:hypothetical protein